MTNINYIFLSNNQDLHYCSHMDCQAPMAEPKCNQSICFDGCFLCTMYYDLDNNMKRLHVSKLKLALHLDHYLLNYSNFRYYSRCASRLASWCILHILLLCDLWPTFQVSRYCYIIYTSQWRCFYDNILYYNLPPSVPLMNHNDFTRYIVQYLESILLSWHILVTRFFGFC